MSDPVNKPAHYTFGEIEPIDAIEDWNLGFHMGNTIKYISRAGRKDPAKMLEDLKKGRWYLDRYIRLLETRAAEANKHPGQLPRPSSSYELCDTGAELLEVSEVKS